MKRNIAIFVLSPLLLIAAPQAPSDLALTPFSTSVKLNWSDNANEQAHFKIFRDDHLITIVSPETTEYIDRFLTPNTSYTYMVKATDDAHIMILDDLKAFPTAEGEGANVKGGRGGEVYYITRCDGGHKGEDGVYDFKGTLGAGLHNYRENNADKKEFKTLPRTMIFTVGGYFDTIYRSPSKSRSLRVSEASSFTIAGQSANHLGGIHFMGNVYDTNATTKQLLSDEIEVRSFDGENSDDLKRITIVSSDDFIIRYISAKGAVDKPDFADDTKTSTGSVLDLQRSTNVIVDHFSGGYASYMLLFKGANLSQADTIKAGNFTLQHSLAHEGWIEHNVVLPAGLAFEPNQSKLEPFDTDVYTAWNSWVGNYDIHHNVSILIDHRQPSNTNGGDSGSFILSSNYTYDWNGRLGRHTGSAKVDLINNVYEKMDAGEVIDTTKLHKAGFSISSYDHDNHPLNPKFYTIGNKINGSFYSTSEIVTHYQSTDYGVEDSPLQTSYISNSPQTNRNYPVTHTATEQVKVDNLTYAGAGVRFDSDGNPLQIDALDNAYIDIANGAQSSSFIGRNGVVSITKPEDSEVGEIARFHYPASYFKQWMIDVSQIPAIDSNSLIADLDNNGIADWWESDSIKIAWDGNAVDTLKFDKDSDGLPDWWEKMHGLNINQQDANSKKTIWHIGRYSVVNNAGYTNLEIYLAHIAGDFHMLDR